MDGCEQKRDMVWLLTGALKLLRRKIDRGRWGGKPMEARGGDCKQEMRLDWVGVVKGVRPGGSVVTVGR